MVEVMVGFIIRNGRKMLGRWKIAISTGKAKKQEEYGKNDRKKQIKSQGTRSRVRSQEEQRWKASEADINDSAMMRAARKRRAQEPLPASCSRQLLFPITAPPPAINRHGHQVRVSSKHMRFS